MHDDGVSCVPVHPAYQPGQNLGQEWGPLVLDCIVQGQDLPFERFGRRLNCSIHCCLLVHCRQHHLWMDETKQAGRECLIFNIYKLASARSLNGPLSG